MHRNIFTELMFTVYNHKNVHLWEGHFRIKYFLSNVLTVLNFPLRWHAFQFFTSEYMNCPKCGVTDILACNIFFIRLSRYYSWLHTIIVYKLLYTVPACFARDPFNARIRLSGVFFRFPFSWHNKQWPLGRARCHIPRVFSDATNSHDQ